MKKGKTLIVIGGATATGKTKMAIQLAQYYQTEILSADSRQFYKEMAIGTAKPTAEELALAKHHFVDFLHVWEDYSVGNYERDAIATLDELFLKKDVAILTGGTGLYLKAVCDGLDEFPPITEKTRNEVRTAYAKKGLQWLQKAVENADPTYFSTMDTANPVRLLRALEVIKESGQPFSSFRKNVPKMRNFNTIFIHLTMERDLLYDRINSRVDKMMTEGLLSEVQSLIQYKDFNALQTVGYKEIFEYLAGDITIERAVELIKRNTRRYAKRQMTWFRNDKRYVAVEATDWSQVLDATRF